MTLQLVLLYRELLAATVARRQARRSGKPRADATAATAAPERPAGEPPPAAPPPASGT
jgi:hypothetical protein